MVTSIAGHYQLDSDQRHGESGHTDHVRGAGRSVQGQQRVPDAPLAERRDAVSAARQLFAQ